MAEDIYKNWRDRLAGKIITLVTDRADAGIYKIKDHGVWKPVYIYPDPNDKDRLVANLWKNKIVDANEIWNRMGPAVKKEDAQYWMDNGRWPGDIEQPAGIGDNSGVVNDVELLRDAMEVAADWLKKTGKIEDSVNADLATNHADKINALQKKVDNERKALIAPLLAEQRRINAEYNPKIEGADKIKKALLRATNDFAIAEEARLRKAREAAEEERRKAEEAQRKLEAEDPIGAALAEPQAPPPPLPEAKVAMGGQAGKRRGLRTFTTYEFVDYDKALATVKDHPDVRDLVLKLCEEEYKKGNTDCGIKQTKERRVA